MSFLHAHIPCRLFPFLLYATSIAFTRFHPLKHLLPLHFFCKIAKLFESIQYKYPLILLLFSNSAKVIFYRQFLKKFIGTYLKFILRLPLFTLSRNQTISTQPTLSIFSPFNTANPSEPITVHFLTAFKYIFLLYQYVIPREN